MALLSFLALWPITANSISANSDSRRVAAVVSDPAGAFEAPALNPHDLHKVILPRSDKAVVMEWEDLHVSDPSPRVATKEWTTALNPPLADEPPTALYWAVYWRRSPRISINCEYTLLRPFNAHWSG